MNPAVHLIQSHVKRRFVAIIVICLYYSIETLAATDHHSNTIAISPDGRTLAVVNNDSASVTLLNIPALKLRTEVFVGPDPQMLAFNSSGSSLFITHKIDDSISEINLLDHSVSRYASICDEPAGIVISKMDLAYISCQAASELVVFDANDRKILSRKKLSPDPRGLTLSHDEFQLYVTHFSSGELSVLETTDLRLIGTVSTGLDSNLSNSVILNQDGSKAFLPQTRSDASNPNLTFDSTVFPIVSVIDLQSLLHLQGERIFIDLVDEPVNMPFDVAFDGADRVFILNAGSNDLSVIDLSQGIAIAHLELGHNPRGMVMAERSPRLYVNNALGGSISVIDTNTLEVIQEKPVTSIPLGVSLLNGKRIFNSSDRIDLAEDQWISCATCHFDGEMDGRTWIFPDGPRNTTSLLGIAETLPMHWSGDLDELHDVESTIRDIQAGSGLAEGSDNCFPACDQAPPNTGRSQDLDDLAAFMESLTLPPNPNLRADGKLSKAARLGEHLFMSEQTRCAECHPPPLYTDRKAHNVGTAAREGENKGNQFDTPSLRGIYKTSPYLHHGDAMTLESVLIEHNLKDRHGNTSSLSEKDIRNLTSFLRSIGQALSVNISSGLTGNWSLPDSENGEVSIHIDTASHQAYLIWFNPHKLYSDANNPWLIAWGNYNGNSATLEIMTDYLSDSERPYGEIELSFTDCLHANLRITRGEMQNPRSISLNRSGAPNCLQN